MNIVVRMADAVVMRSRVSRKVHARFWSRAGQGDLSCLGSLRSDIAFDPNFQPLEVMRGTAPNNLLGVWE